MYTDFLKHNCYGRDAKTDCTCCDCRLFVLMEKCHTLHEVKLMAFLFIQPARASHYILPAMWINVWPSLFSFGWAEDRLCLAYADRHTMLRNDAHRERTAHTTADNCLNDDVVRCTACYSIHWSVYMCMFVYFVLKSSQRWNSYTFTTLSASMIYTVTWINIYSSVAFTTNIINRNWLLCLNFVFATLANCQNANPHFSMIFAEACLS